MVARVVAHIKFRKTATGPDRGYSPTALRSRLDTEPQKTGVVTRYNYSSGRKQLNAVGYI